MAGAYAPLGAGLRARVTTACRGCRDGEVHVRWFQAGDEVSGELAEALVGAGQAVVISQPLETKQEVAPAGSGPLEPGAVKSSPSPRRGRAKAKPT